VEMENGVENRRGECRWEFEAMSFATGLNKEQKKMWSFRLPKVSP
jgi:hypothetical protein